MFDGVGVRGYPSYYLRSDSEILIMTVFSAKNTSSLNMLRWCSCTWTSVHLRIASLRPVLRVDMTLELRPGQVRCCHGS